MRGFLIFFPFPLSLTSPFSITAVAFSCSGGSRTEFTAKMGIGYRRARPASRRCKIPVVSLYIVKINVSLVFSFGILSESFTKSAQNPF